MNTDIETLLRKAPPVRPPSGLLGTLNDQIDLAPGAATARPRDRATDSSWFPRWIPAVGFALWFLGCVVVFGIQASQMAELREQKRAVQAAKAAAEQEVVAARASAMGVAAELKQLKKDLAEVQRLTAEVEQLRAERAALPALRAGNEQLRAELKARGALAPKPEQDFFAGVARQQERDRCVNNLRQVGLAARLWANDHGDRMPPNYEAMKNELVNDKRTFCPSDGATRFRYLSPGVDESDPRVVLTHCPIHNAVGLIDGSAQLLQDHHRLLQRNGKWIVEGSGN
jgi:hypothetical protein